MNNDNSAEISQSVNNTSNTDKASNAKDNTDNLETESSSGSKFPNITPETIHKKEALIEYIPLVEMTAHKELGTMPSHLGDFRELVNLGLIKVNDLIKKAHKENKEFSPSYIIQGIAWSIKNKNRKEATQRGEFKSKITTTEYVQDWDGNITLAEVQEAVIDTVASLDNSEVEVADKYNVSPEEAILMSELHKTVHNAIALLPENYKQVIEMRFFKNMKGIEIARKLNLSSARVTRIIQDSINHMKKRFSDKKFL